VKNTNKCEKGHPLQDGSREKLGVMFRHLAKLENCLLVKNTNKGEK
jgi:hypothetical protein